MRFACVVTRHTAAMTRRTIHVSGRRAPRVVLLVDDVTGAADRAERDAGARDEHYFMVRGHGIKEI
jgi:hypothetical protein